MSAVPTVTKENHSYTAGAAILGGRICQARTDGAIEHASAGSTKWLGAAKTDAINAATQSTSPTIVAGRPVLNTALLPTVVALTYGGKETVVEYAADAAFGDSLICAANGFVAPAGANPDARTVVGKCTQPGGVVVATKPTGLARIN